MRNRILIVAVATALTCASTAAWAHHSFAVFFDASKVYDVFKSGVDFKTLQTNLRANGYLPNPIPNIGLPD